jgi:hypothetical protein
MKEPKFKIGQSVNFKNNPIPVYPTIVVKMHINGEWNYGVSFLSNKVNWYKESELTNEPL